MALVWATASGAAVDVNKATVTDLDGNVFYDLTGSYGVNLFGNDFYKLWLALAEFIGKKDSWTSTTILDLDAEGIEREAALGSRTTTDVLDAQRDLLTARVTAERAWVSEYVARATLLAAIGRLNAAALGAPLPPPRTPEEPESPF